MAVLVDRDLDYGGPSTSNVNCSAEPRLIMDYSWGLDGGQVISVADLLDEETATSPVDSLYPSFTNPVDLSGENLSDAVHTVKISPHVVSKPAQRACEPTEPQNFYVNTAIGTLSPYSTLTPGTDMLVVGAQALVHVQYDGAGWAVTEIEARELVYEFVFGGQLQMETSTVSDSVRFQFFGKLDMPRDAHLVFRSSMRMQVHHCESTGAFSGLKQPLFLFKWTMRNPKNGPSHLVPTCPTRR